MKQLHFGIIVIEGGCFLRQVSVKSLDELRVLGYLAQLFEPVVEPKLAQPTRTTLWSRIRAKRRPTNTK